MSGLINLNLGNLVRAGMDGLDNLFTSDKERLEIALDDKRVDATMMAGQQNINLQEAKHRSLFVAGWRPFIGWVGGCSLAYNFLLYPMLCWAWKLGQAYGKIPAGVEPPPLADASQLYPIVVGMLGFGTMRTVEGIKGKKAENMTQAKQQRSGFKWPWKK
ncbi:3TM-type holin [Desulfosediminicola sp.]|uniref:3TM-type holin n=1 Tax=Desulfosediminicola sp. TaxID=2886825 RepID=UPI003AF30216